MILKWLKDKPIVGLSPMDGWTDSPMRQMSKKFGADFVISEMIPAAGLIRQPERLANLVSFTESERPIALQIFGNKPSEMAEACRILNDGYDNFKIKLQVSGGSCHALPSRPDILASLRVVDGGPPSVPPASKTRNFIPDEINLNFGCPAKSAVKGGFGAILMDQPVAAEAMVKAAVRASRLPITVKMRLGYQSATEAVPFAQRMEQAGAAALYIHGRTFKQKYEGVADWLKIKEVAAAVKIPVLGNGDVKSLEFGVWNSEFGKLAGVLIGRAARGNPWIFSQEIKEISLEDRIQVITDHLDLINELCGQRGVFAFRKHLLFYLKNLPNATEVKKQVLKFDDFFTLKNYLKNLLLDK